MSDLREAMARAMRAQGKVEPEAVFEAAAEVDLDDHEPATPSWRHDPGHEPPPLDPEQEALALEERGYGYEP